MNYPHSKRELETERERLAKLLIEARIIIVELVDGIKKHRKDMWGVPGKEMMRVGHPIDEELYKLVEEKEEE